METLLLPQKVNLGSGKNWQEDCLNVDCNPYWQPDLVLDFNQPLPFGTQIKMRRFGDFVLSQNQIQLVLAIDVLEHISQLTIAMSSLLDWLQVHGQLVIQVPYDLSLGAWQDPTHVRAFNENSWLYYTDWYWYLGWQKARFDLKNLTFLFSEYGEELQAQGHSQSEILRQPRAVDAMRVVLQKRMLP